MNEVEAVVVALGANKEEHDMMLSRKPCFLPETWTLIENVDRRIERLAKMRVM